MDRPKLKVADVLRRYGEAYREQRAASMSTTQRRVMSAIEPSNCAGLPLSAVTGNIAINAPTNALGQGEADVEVLGIEIFSLTILANSVKAAPFSAHRYDPWAEPYSRVQKGNEN